MDSKYNYLRFGIAFLSVPIFIFILYNFTNGEFSFIQNAIENPSFGTLIIIIVLISFVMNLVNMIVQLRKLKFNSSEIEAKYLFPVFDKTLRWSDLDYFVIVEVANKRKDQENIWLVKDQKVSMIISSEFYKNFDEMKNYLSTRMENRNLVKISWIDHFLAKFNFTINKLP